MRIALALGLHPIALTTLGFLVPRGTALVKAIARDGTTMSNRSWPAAA
jgi:hypothetical protein